MLRRNARQHYFGENASLARRMNLQARQAKARRAFDY